jgi:2'-5' RNA ligase
LSFSLHRPFIDDPNDIARFEGRRFVVLRATGAVRDVHCDVRSSIKGQLDHADVSYPAQAHVTLAGFPKGTPLEAIRDLVAQWARTVAPLRLEVEKAGYFPAPFQIVMLQIRKTTELFDALASLRARARERELGEEEMVPAADWIFHMSAAYCSSLGSQAWAAVTQCVDGLSVQPAECVVGEVEIVAFDNSQEYSGPVGALDGVVIVNAYHEMPKGVAVLKHVFEALKPGGRLVLCEPVPRTMNQSRKVQMADHVLDPTLVLEDVRAAGFRVLDRQDMFATNLGGTHFGFLVARRP